MKSLQVRECAILQHFGGVYEEIAAYIVDNLFHNFERLCIEIVQRKVLLMKGARLRRALRRVDVCALWNAVCMHVDCL